MTGTKERILSADFVILSIASLFLSLVLRMLDTALPVYIDNIGGDTGISGILVGSAAVASFFIRPFTGRWVDRYGAKLVLTLFALLSAVVVLILGFVSFLPVMLALRVAQGITVAGYSTALEASIVYVIPRERLGEGLGYYGLGAIVSSLFGPMIGLGLNARGGIWVFAAAAVLSGGAAAVSVFTRGNRRVERSPAATPAENTGRTAETRVSIWSFYERDALPATAIQLVLVFSTSIVGAFLAVYAGGACVNGIGTFFVASGVASIVIKLLLSGVSDRVKPVYILVPSIVLICLSLVMIPMSKTFGGFMFIAIIYGTGQSLIGQILKAQAVKNASDDRQGKANATFSSAFDIGGGFGPMVWGLVIGAFGYGTAFSAAALCAASAAALLVINNSYIGRKSL